MGELEREVEGGLEKEAMGENARGEGEGELEKVVGTSEGVTSIVKREVGG